MLTVRRLRDLFWGAVVSCLVLPASARSAPADPQLIPMATYLTSIATIHFCSCNRWPVCWVEFRRFDDRLHERGVEQGQEPQARFPWDDYAQSRLDLDAKGQLRVQLRSGTNTSDFGVILPDCSESNPSVLKNFCSNDQCPQAGK